MTSRERWCVPLIGLGPYVALNIHPFGLQTIHKKINALSVSYAVVVCSTPWPSLRVRDRDDTRGLNEPRGGETSMTLV